MKIVIPVLSVGPSGGYRVLSELASTWVRLGHEVSILAKWMDQFPYFPTRANIVWLDDSGNRIDPALNLNPPQRKGFDHVYHNLLSLWRGLNREAHDADVVLANHSLTAWPVFMSRTRSQKFYYIQAYEPEIYAQYHNFRKGILRWISQGSYILPLRHIVNAPIYLNAAYSRATDFIPAGIDLKVMFPQKQKYSWNGRTIILGCLGRKEPNKGLATVLDAFELLLQRGHPVELHIAHGNIPDGRTLPSNTKVIVPRNDVELAEYYRSLDIMIALGFLQVGAPYYPVMEAMACGVPVISNGAMPASVDANNSWIVPIKDPVATANSVEEIVSNSQLRDERVRNALKDIQDFSWDRVAPKMLTLFEAALGEKRNESR